MNLIELITKTKEQIVEESLSILNQFNQINGINIPDIMSLPIRSFESAEHLLDEKILTFPHIRTIDRSAEDSIKIISKLMEKGLGHLLIISGDPIPCQIFPSKPVTTPELIKLCKQTFPKLKVYAGFDPYRQSIKQELTYIEEKLKAGSDGFFTQPFFDPNLARIYLDQLTSSTVFLGISPVLTEQNKAYWINRNHVVFPPNFTIDLNLNIQLDRQLMELAQEYQQHTYLMPITMPPSEYLGYLLNESPSRRS